MLSSEFCETVKNTIFTDHLGTPASEFIEHAVILQNLISQSACYLVLISQSVLSSHLGHSEILKCIHVKSKLDERENLFSFFTSDSVNLLISVVHSFMTEVPII